MQVGDLVKTIKNDKIIYGLVTGDGTYSIKVLFPREIKSKWISKEYLEVVSESKRS